MSAIETESVGAAPSATPGRGEDAGASRTLATRSSARSLGRASTSVSRNSRWTRRRRSRSLVGVVPAPLRTTIEAFADEVPAVRSRLVALAARADRQAVPGCAE